MVKTKAAKAGFTPIKPIEKPSQKAPDRKVAQETKVKADFSIDVQALSALLGKKEAGRVSSTYFTGAPVWTPEAKKRLHGFIVNALSKNKLFADKPLALEETAAKVLEAITKSPNLTAMFLPKMSNVS